ncbi:MAG: YybH family protein [bacterium]
MQQSGEPGGCSTPEEVELAFYRAFSRCDAKAMVNVWTPDSPVCIHPGSPALLGLESILNSWRSILENVEPPRLEVDLLRKFKQEDLSIHVVEERLYNSQGDCSTVLATNIYRPEKDGWRMIEHHGSIVRSTSHHVQEPVTLQ